MCDYSLHDVASRPAKVGDKLTSKSFRTSFTRGFAAVGEPNVAVCLLPGTELAFDAPVECTPAFGLFRNKRIEQQVARFRQINLHEPHMHHDALEFPDGQVVLVTNLSEGQQAMVLQLPAQAQESSEPAQHETAPAQQAQPQPAERTSFRAAVLERIFG